MLRFTVELNSLNAKKNKYKTPKTFMIINAVLLL